MYLMIYESGDAVRFDDLTGDDIQACDDGVCDMFDVSEANNPKRYFNGEWHEIDTVMASPNNHATQTPKP